jgi:hypothetical protein
MAQADLVSCFDGLSCSGCEPMMVWIFKIVKLPASAANSPIYLA